MWQMGTDLSGKSADCLNSDSVEFFFSDGTAFEPQIGQFSSERLVTVQKNPGIIIVLL